MMCSRLASILYPLVSASPVLELEMISIVLGSLSKIFKKDYAPYFIG
jgi:hypothetical protein